MKVKTRMDKKDLESALWHLKQSCQRQRDSLLELKEREGRSLASRRKQNQDYSDYSQSSGFRGQLGKRPGTAKATKLTVNIVRKQENEAEFDHLG